MTIKTADENSGARALLDWIADALVEKQGREIMAFDARNLAGVTDYYLLVSALSAPHVKALFNAVRLALKARGVACYRKSGTPESGWIVADYLDVVLHIFNRETRGYYALEELWADVPRVELKSAAPPAASTPAPTG